MLKIKDKIDLKELEKFGFREMPYKWYGMLLMKKISSSDMIVYIDNDRTIWEMDDEDNYSPNPVLHQRVIDLIKADLIEKVDE